MFVCVSVRVNSSLNFEPTLHLHGAAVFDQSLRQLSCDYLICVSLSLEVLSCMQFSVGVGEGSQQKE
jgi:hypothetical protein